MFVACFVINIFHIGTSGSRKKKAKTRRQSKNFTTSEKSLKTQREERIWFYCVSGKSREEKGEKDTALSIDNTTRKKKKCFSILFFLSFSFLSLIRHRPGEKGIFRQAPANNRTARACAAHALFSMSKGWKYSIFISLFRPEMSALTSKAKSKTQTISSSRERNRKMKRFRDDLMNCRLCHDAC